MSFETRGVSKQMGFLGDGGGGSPSNERALDVRDVSNVSIK
jgi:hypothetical protein